MYLRRRQSISAAVVVLSTTAGRRIQARRISSNRTVFEYRSTCSLQTDSDDAAEPVSAVAAGLARWSTRASSSAVASTVLRPLADAANTGLFIFTERDYAA